LNSLSRRPRSGCTICFCRAPSRKAAMIPILRHRRFVAFGQFLHTLGESPANAVHLAVNGAIWRIVNCYSVAQTFFTKQCEVPKSEQGRAIWSKHDTSLVRVISTLDPAGRGPLISPRAAVDTFLFSCRLATAMIMLIPRRTAWNACTPIT
jgi:hypothetical protein